MSAEKIFPPSKRKLERARAKGDVAKSRELSAAIMLAAVLLNLLVFKASLPSYFLLFGDVLDGSRSNFWLVLEESIRLVVFSTLPFLFILKFVVILVEVLQVGISFRFDFFNLKRLDFFVGIKQIFFVGGENSNKSFFYNLFKHLVLTFGFFTIFLTFLYLEAENVIGANFAEINQVISVSYIYCLKLYVAAILFSILVGSFDFVVQKNRRTKRLSMDLAELKRELRETEGDPEIKARRRENHLEILEYSTLQNIKNVRVVVDSED